MIEVHLLFNCQAISRKSIFRKSIFQTEEGIKANACWYSCFLFWLWLWLLFIWNEDWNNIFLLCNILRFSYVAARQSPEKKLSKKKKTWRQMPVFLWCFLFWLWLLSFLLQSLSSSFNMFQLSCLVFWKMSLSGEPPAERLRSICSCTKRFAFGVAVVGCPVDNCSFTVHLAVDGRSWLRPLSGAS